MNQEPSKTLWVVVAHRAGARILRRRAAGHALEPIERFEHPRGRMKNIELETDRPGAARVGVASGRFEEHDDAHTHDAKTFAREIAGRLTDGRNQHDFDELVLVAEPRFLGVLNDALDAGTKKLVRATVAKDLAHVEDREVATHLGSALPL